MGLRDVTGVFSRYFVVGFFLPAFFAVVVISVIVANDRSYDKLVSQDRLLGLGGAALIVGLLLLGLRHPLWKLFEGVISDRNGWGFSTAFGSRTDAYRRRGEENWDGLDVFLTWPLIAALLPTEERELHVELETDVRFFLNSVPGVLAIGVATAAEGYDTSVLYLMFVPLAVFLAWLVYRCGVMAVDRWGPQKVASAALHRLELYHTLGIPPDDPGAARKTNDLLRVAPYDESAPISAASREA